MSRFARQESEECHIMWLWPLWGCWALGTEMFKTSLLGTMSPHKFGLVRGLGTRTSLNVQYFSAWADVRCCFCPGSCVSQARGFWMLCSLWGVSDVGNTMRAVVLWLLFFFEAFKALLSQPNFGVYGPIGVFCFLWQDRKNSASSKILRVLLFIRRCRTGLMLFCSCITGLLFFFGTCIPGHLAWFLLWGVLVCFWGSGRLSVVLNRDWCDYSWDTGV